MCMCGACLLTGVRRHPVTNDYLPIEVRDEVFLRAEGDKTGKVWDEAALAEWEVHENGGKPWAGRPQPEDSEGGRPSDLGCL